MKLVTLDHRVQSVTQVLVDHKVTRDHQGLLDKLDLLEPQVPQVSVAIPV